MYRNIYSSILGFYSQSAFRIGIETNLAFMNMNEKDYSILAHEYMHFLQDITTSYGAFCAYSISEYIKSVADSIRESKDGTIKIPYTPEPGDDNVFANYYVRSLTYGDYNEIKSVSELIELRNLQEALESKDLDSFPVIELLLKDGEGNPKTVYLGACAVMESLAYMMERFIAPLSLPSPDYPYAIVEKIVEMIYPEFGNDVLNVIALCDVSLLTSSPGHTLVCYLVQFKEDAWLPNQPEDVYDKVLAGGFKVQGSEPCTRTFEEEMNEMCRLSIESVNSYFAPELVRYRKWIKETFTRGFELRSKKPTFMLDIARDGDIRNNRILKYLIEEYLGTPIITNPWGEATIKSPAVPFDSDFFLFPAIGEVMKLFESGICKCSLKECCARLDGPGDDKCDSEPWSHEVRKEKPCPYSLLWHNWRFKGCTPIKHSI